MKQFSKHITLLLILAVFSNGLFAAHMAVSMVELAIKTGQQSPLCHSENQQDLNSAQDFKSQAAACCEADCSSCVSGSSLVSDNGVVLTTSPRLPLLAAVNNHQLPAHSNNLYRPPILI